MKGKRRRHEPEFKATVALEALKGIKTIQQIAQEYDIHPVQVSDWKKVMQGGAGGIFSGPKASVDHADLDRERTRLHAKIGELSVEVDYLKKKCRQLGLPPG